MESDSESVSENRLSGEDIGGGDENMAVVADRRRLCELVISPPNEVNFPKLP